jgi:hypothetical protein
MLKNDFDLRIRMYIILLLYRTMSEASEDEPRVLKLTKQAIAKRKYYNENKSNVQRTRIISTLQDLANGDLEARRPSLKTLKKYGLYNEETGKVEIPTKYKSPEINYANVLPEPERNQIIDVVRVNANTPITTYNSTNDNVNGAELQNWVFNVLSNEPLKSGEVRSKQTLQGCANIGKILFAVYGEKYTDKSDFLPKILDVTRTLELWDKYSKWNKSSSKEKPLSYLLKVVQSFPPLVKAVSKSIIEIYDAKFRDYKGLAFNEQDSAKKPVFEWRIIRNAIFSVYGRESYESLYILLLNQIIGRDNFGSYIRNISDPTPSKDKNNYLILDRPNKKATFLMQDYKTKGVFGTQAIVLDTQIVNLIIKLHPTNISQQTLFPANIQTNKQKLGNWIKNQLKKIPLFKDEQINVNYLRHSIISSAIARISSNADRPRVLLDLANRAFHSVGSQKKYINELKDEDGKIIIINPDSAREFDRITTQLNENDGTIEDGEEITSKPKLNKGTKPISKDVGESSKRRDNLLLEATKLSASATKPIPKDVGESSKRRDNLLLEATKLSREATKPNEGLRRSARIKKPVQKYEGDSKLIFV